MSNRSACIWGCGRMVLKSNGECRKCRRQRLKDGRKKTAKASLGLVKITPPFETAKQKFDRVRGKVWNRPKFGSIVREMMRPFRPIDPEASLGIFALLANMKKKANPSPAVTEEGQVVTE